MDFPFCGPSLNPFLSIIDYEGIDNIVMDIFINFSAGGIASVVEDGCSLHWDLW